MKKPQELSYDEAAATLTKELMSRGIDVSADGLHPNPFFKDVKRHATRLLLRKNETGLLKKSDQELYASFVEVLRDFDSHGSNVKKSSLEGLL